MFDIMDKLYNGSSAGSNGDKFEWHVLPGHASILWCKFKSIFSDEVVNDFTSII